MNLGRSPNYLIHNSHSFCFRMRVPEDLQRYFGKKELKYSLKTGYIRTAKNKARYLAGFLQVIFERLRYGGYKLKLLTDEKIQELTSQYVKKALKDLETRSIESDGKQESIPFFDQPSFDNYISDLDNIKDDLVLNLNLCDYSMLENKIKVILEDAGIEAIDKESIEYRKLCAEVHMAAIKLIPIEKQHLLCDFSYKENLHEIFPEIYTQPLEQSTTTVESPANTSAKLLSHVIQEFWDENESAENWGERTKNDYNTGKKLMLKILGDVPINNLEFSKIRYLKTSLQKLPPYLNSNEYKGKSIAEILAIGKGKKREPRTIKKNLDFARSFFRWANHNQYIDIDLAKILYFKETTKRRSDEERSAFDINDLVKIFHSEKYIKDKHTHANEFYLPVLGLYTGCRLDKCISCQLPLSWY